MDRTAVELSTSVRRSAQITRASNADMKPRILPFFPGTRGVELVIEHIEKYWCPSILGESLIQTITGTAGPISTTE